MQKVWQSAPELPDRLGLPAQLRNQKVLRVKVAYTPSTPDPIYTVSGLLCALVPVSASVGRIYFLQNTKSYPGLPPCSYYVDLCSQEVISTGS